MDDELNHEEQVPQACISGIHLNVSTREDTASGGSDPIELESTAIGSPDDEKSTEIDEPSPRSRVSYGSSQSTNRSSRHQRMGSINSVGDTNYNESSHSATHSAYTTSNGLVPPMGGDLEEMHIRARITPLDCCLFLTGIGLEVSSVVFDLLSSPEKPHYALAGMLCANVAVVLCILELICKGITQRELLSSQNNIRSKIMIMLPEITGLGLAIIQCISSAVQFYYYSRHADNRLKACLAGIYFTFCLFLLKFRWN